MVKKILISIAFFIVLFFLSDFFSQKILSNSSGAPPGYSGSPTDGFDCSACHAHMDTVVDNVYWITTDVPIYGYNHTMVYNITVTIPDSGHKGFEISILDNLGNQAGYMMATDANTQLVGSGKYITHTTPGISNPQTWSFQWGQYMAGYGNATIYGAFTVDTNATYIQTLTLPEEPCTNCHGGIPTSGFDNTDIYLYSYGNMVRVFINSSMNRNIDLYMYSANGDQIKFCKNAFPAMGQNYLNIDTGTLNNGIYFIVANCDVFTKALKFLISK